MRSGIVLTDGKPAILVTDRAGEHTHYVRNRTVSVVEKANGKLTDKIVTVQSYLVDADGLEDTSIPGPSLNATVYGGADADVDQAVEMLGKKTVTALLGL